MEESAEVVGSATQAAGLELCTVAAGCKASSLALLLN